MPADIAEDQRTQTGFETLLGYHLRLASQVVQADLAKTLAPFGLRMVTFSALIIVRDVAGLRQTQLADALSMERPNLVAIVDELEAAGLLLRTPSPTDRRAHALYLTSKGQETLEDAFVAVQEHENRIFGALSEKDKAALKSALKTIYT